MSSSTNFNRRQPYHLTNVLLKAGSIILISTLSILPLTVFACFIVFACFAAIFYTLSTQTTTLNRHNLYHQTNRILNRHSLHCIPISLLFLPFTFAVSTAFRFYFPSFVTEFNPFNILIIKTITASYQNLLTFKTIFTILAFHGFVILPTIAGVASITYNTNQIINNKPLTFSSTLKSLSRSYIPLVTTLIIDFLTYTLSLIVLLYLYHDHAILLTDINFIVLYALIVTLSFFIVVWGPAATITVLESNSGFQTLPQIFNQATEHSFFTMLVTRFGVKSALLFSLSPQVSGSAANWMLIVQVGVMYLLCMAILVYVVANTVWYVQCKVASEEIAKTAVEREVSGEYVRLVGNDEDGEVFRELAKEEANRGVNNMLNLLGAFLAILLGVHLYKNFFGSVDFKYVVPT